MLILWPKFKVDIILCSKEVTSFSFEGDDQKSVFPETFCANFGLESGYSKLL